MVSNHDELMCNFFAQADALATGKTPVELRAGNVPDSLIPHKTFTGNRPSTSILLPELTAYTVGQILSLYGEQDCSSGKDAGSGASVFRKLYHVLVGPPVEAVLVLMPVEAMCHTGHAACCLSMQKNPCILGHSMQLHLG